MGLAIRLASASSSRSTSVPMPRFRNVSTICSSFYYDVVGLDSGLKVAGVLAVGDDDADFFEHELPPKSCILDCFVPIAVQPLPEPSHAA